MSNMRFFHPRALLGSVAALVLTGIAHRNWRTRPHGTPGRGILDLTCHLGTACAVTLPILPNTKHAREFGLIAVSSAVALDLDHIVAARSLEMRNWMTMPSRPPTHSVGALIALAWAIERMAPGRRLWLATAIGIGSHLLRDLATGGAPLWHPRRIIHWPAPAVMAALCILPVIGWFLAGLPSRTDHPGNRDVRHKERIQTFPVNQTD
jgi:hypothetical protein